MMEILDFLGGLKVPYPDVTIRRPSDENLSPVYKDHRQ